MPEQQKTVAQAVELIRTLDASDAAIALAERLKLNAEVRTCVGKWDNRGSITGWTKTGKTKGRLPATTLVEVFISDLNGEDREFDQYARRMQSLIDENKALKLELAQARGDHA